MVMAQSVQVAIVGGGMVGMATALGLARAGISVAVIDRAKPEAASGPYDVRVSAINRASELYLRQLGAWQRMSPQRLSAYTGMKVWDKDSIGNIEFDASDYNQPDLGHIIENRVIAHALWQQAEHDANIKCFFGAPQSVAFGEHEAWITLADGGMLSARLLVAADGANSWLRQQLNVPLSFRDYGHHGLVATVQCSRPHEGIARQVFLPQGPLALLPLPNPNQCSIVWSLPPEQAQELTECDAEAFCQRITLASEAALGKVEVVSDRLAIPLTMRYAWDFVLPRLALVGDAAHTIHPLAGQGVNLGLADSEHLVSVIKDAVGKGRDIGDLRVLQRYARPRKAAAQEMIAAMSGFKWLFAGQDPVKKGVRDIGLALVNRIPGLKRKFIEQALGVATTNLR
ncbi:2-octaprenyl-6-methoxyphenol hydroxylase /2-octaprenyl-3-methyl-6-methoxy-1,4-benzoquinol hydroxylase [Ferrimonas sediminum]|uniref:2-octaprenyl-6-methoxyphenol hydroxylase /2-octaprenyl-3-methyl-6-methoxy-1,4-benzoquinol hydroxylase n=1 Tax=Ferrimonas sediminum TaxID=718193 RepID=A0A1G8T147_9GAMM|nr:FAD-dependent oxidoreductase [Ferrimonas sediminum]SDJ34745.1 2-octaprenyl-6-methoxyphenol hydroxylase /2-octaprenyl-3-methyl-6-methoxy-1,4-benzoquinol hydroxylase [Ferrimonas sediminum]